MSTFEDRLWSQLVAEHEQRLRAPSSPVAPTIAPTRHNHRRRLLTSTALATAALATALALALGASTSTPPAYAVTPTATAPSPSRWTTSPRSPGSMPS